MFFFIFSSILICHILACLWIFFTQLADSEDNHWLNVDEKYTKMSDIDIYLTSFYFIITTSSTIGYGDISGTNNLEKFFCIIMMCLGVTAFARGTSELTNLLQTYD